MLIKISKELDGKLIHISKASGVKKAVIIQKIFEGFIDRYEKKKGKKIVPAQEKQSSDLWLMFTVFKKYYALYNNGAEYELDRKQQAIQLRYMRLTKEKILQMVMNMEKTDIVSINDQDLVNSYEFLLSKIPEWWRKNGFTPHSIYKNFEKILGQIKNGKQSGKDALDDFISSLN
jgi:hypothetical protein